MNKLEPFFIIGVIGMLVSSTLHMGMALVLELQGVNAIFFTLYAVFLGFLVIGMWQMLRPVRVRSRK